MRAGNSSGLKASTDGSAFPILPSLSGTRPNHTLTNSHVLLFCSSKGLKECARGEDARLTP